MGSGVSKSSDVSTFTGVMLQPSYDTQVHKRKSTSDCSPSTLTMSFKKDVKFFSLKHNPNETTSNNSKSFARLRNAFQSSDALFRTSFVHTMKHFSDFYTNDVDQEGRCIVLGEGGFSKVSSCSHITSKTQYACKAFSGGRDVELAAQEIIFLGEMDHPNIVRFHEAYVSQAKRSASVVLEKCEGPSLAEYLKQRGSVLPELEVCALMRQMLGAVLYMQARGIVHRDIKLENWVFRDANCTQLVLIDLSLSCRFSGGNDISEQVGTPAYWAPEMVQMRYGAGCDIWSLGIICFHLLCGQFPFYAETEPELFSKILDGKLSFAEFRGWEAISAEAVNFTSSLLAKDSGLRPTANRALCHDWFKLLPLEVHSLAPVKVLEQTKQQILAFASHSLLKQVALNIVAHYSHSQERLKAATAFSVLDPSNSGHLLLEDLLGADTNLNNLSEEDLQLAKAFQSIDRSWRGWIPFNEFCALFLDPSSLPVSEWRNVFQILASRGADGSRIDVKSIKAVVPKLWPRDCPEEAISQVLPLCQNSSEDGICESDFITLMCSS